MLRKLEVTISVAMVVMRVIMIIIIAKYSKGEMKMETLRVW